MRPAVKTELPGPKSRALMARGAFDMQSGYRALVLDDAASDGVWLVDADGNTLLDLFGHFALGALGYNHPRLLQTARSEAFARAAANPTSTPFVAAPAWFDVVEGMREFSPRGTTAIYCVDAGGEGVESALKAAFIAHGERRREAAGLPKNPLDLDPAQQRRIVDNAGTDALVLSFAGGFHGRGLGPLSATHSKVIHKADLPAFPWPAAPFPANRWPLARFAAENERAEAEALRALERILDQHRGKVAAVLIEPVQCEGGDRHASAAFFQGVQLLARQAGAAFALDEVQTGVGVTGSVWAHEQFDLPEPPDLVAFGKKMQLGGFFAVPALAVSQFGRMYQTRNGDRARGLLGLCTLRAVADLGLCDKARETGGYFLARLERLAARHAALTEPRGRGLLLAFDLPTPAARDDFLARALRRGVLCSYTGTRSVRLRPYLVTSAEEVDIAIGVFDEVLAEMSR